MTKPIDGECERCGYPGIVDMSCSECGGQIISLVEEKPATNTNESDQEDDGRYDPDDIATVSLDDLAEEEEALAHDTLDETL